MNREEITLLGFEIVAYAGNSWKRLKQHKMGIMPKQKN